MRASACATERALLIAFEQFVIETRFLQPVYKCVFQRECVCVYGLIRIDVTP